MCQSVNSQQKLSSLRINIGKKDVKKQAGKVVWLFFTIFGLDSPVVEPCVWAQPQAARSSVSSSRVRICSSLPNHAFQRRYGLFWFWANRQAAAVKARLLRLAFGLALRALLLCLLAALLYRLSTL